MDGCRPLSSLSPIPWAGMATLQELTGWRWERLTPPAAGSQATFADLDSAQSPLDQEEKSQGLGPKNNHVPPPSGMAMTAVPQVSAKWSAFRSSAGCVRP